MIVIYLVYRDQNVSNAKNDNREKYSLEEPWVSD